MSDPDPLDDLALPDDGLAEAAAADGEATAADAGPQKADGVAEGWKVGDPGPQPPKRTYDWERAKKLYVEGVTRDEGIHYPSLREVAALVGAPENRIKEKSATAGWTAERAAWQAQVEVTRRQARANAMTQKAVKLDNDAVRVAETGLTLVQAKMTEVAQAAQRARSEAGPGGGSGGSIDPLELTRLAQAADLFHKIGLRAVGDPETHRLEITGANGAPIEIAAQLRRDDPERISSVLAVLHQAGLEDVLGKVQPTYRDRPDLELGGTGDVVDGELVDDGR